MKRTNQSMKTDLEMMDDGISSQVPENNYCNYILYVREAKGKSEHVK